MREDHPAIPEKTRASSKDRAFSSIQGRLVSLLLLVLVPILVAQAYFRYDRYQSSRKVESVANLELARATAKAFDTFVQDVLHQELAIGLAFTSSQPLSEKEQSQILFDNQAGNPAIWHFFWDNPAGMVMAATGSQFIGMDISDREFYREIVAGKDWVVSDLILSKTTGQPSFTISRGIRNERGELLGIIVAGILPDKLDRVLAVERPGDAGVSLLDSKGMHVYRYPATQYTWEQRNWLKLYPVLEEVIKGKEAVITGHVSKIRGEIKRIVAFTPVPAIGWIASCSRAEKESVGPIISAALQEAGLILLVALVSLLSAFALSRTISSSVINLRNHALSLGRGETENSLTNSGPSEIKDLTEAFNKMAEEMRFREKALRESERREQERAAELAVVLDAAPVPIFIAHDPECLHLSGNRAADELLRNPRGAEASLSAPVEVRPQHFKAVKDGRELHTDELPAQRAASGVPVRDFEFNLLFEGGTTYNVLGYGMPLLDDEGRPRGSVHVLVDFTERKRAEEAIKQSQKTFAEAIKRSPFGTYIVDSQFCIAMMNVASQEGAFCNVRPVIGRDFAEAMRI
ncbi:MAG: cache domain-containing protein, partial [Desulfatirhabdiaceae bacterium]